ncbi:MAG: carbohydrate kinase family protein [Opitutaceae bacterium]|nr:carbohydrate kinase family protein [Opitutaceae bacterium]
MRSGIIAGGNWIVDHTKIVDAWPAQDALVTILHESSGNGGSAYNILKDLACLGAPFPLAGIGLIGDDNTGRSILADCDAHRIDSAQLHRTATAATSYTDVMTVKATGRRTFFHQRGANAHLGPEHFDFTQTTAKTFHLGYLLLLDRLDAIAADGQTGAAEVLRRARASGLRTSLDCVSDQSDRFRAVAAPALPHVDYFFANDYEAEKLTGIPLRACLRLDSSAVRAASRALLDAGVHSWVFIHFTEGSFAASRQDEIWQPSLRVPPHHIKGAAGAGDAFAAGVLYGLHEDWPVAECLRLGVCAAASSLYDPSCSAGMKPVQECLQLAETLGYNALAS